MATPAPAERRLEWTPSRVDRPARTLARAVPGTTACRTRRTTYSGWLARMAVARDPSWPPRPRPAGEGVRAACGGGDMRVKQAAFTTPPSASTTPCSTRMLAGQHRRRQATTFSGVDRPARGRAGGGRSTTAPACSPNASSPPPLQRVGGRWRRQNRCRPRRRVDGRWEHMAASSGPSSLSCLITILSETAPISFIVLAGDHI